MTIPSARSSTRGLVLLAALLLLIQAAPTSAQQGANPKPAGSGKPAWRRVLTGEDAKQVAALEKQIAELRGADKFVEAEAPAKTILMIRNRVQGPDHWQTADARRLLATLERLAGLPAAARTELARANEREQQALQAYKQGHYAEAGRQLQRALAIRRLYLGEEHPDTVRNYSAVAVVLSAQGRSAEAGPVLEKVLALRRRTLGEEHPDTATSYNNLAEYLVARGRYAEAGPLLEKALAIRRRTVGEEDPSTASSYNNLATNLDEQGRHAEARPLLEKALAIRRRTLGEEDPSTATSYSNLAAHLNDQGQYTEASALFEKALAIRRRVLGEEHPDTAASYSNLAVTLNARGQYTEAWPLLEKALAICRRALGEEHPQTAAAYNNLAFNLGAQGRDGEAQPLYEKALAIYRRTRGEKHPETANAYNNLALNLSAQERYAEAGSLLEKASTIYRQTLGEEDPHTAGAYNNLAFNLSAQGQYALAQPLYEKALALRRKVLGEAHPDTATSYGNLAYNLAALGRYAEAQPLCEKALAIRRRALGEEHLNTARAYNNLASNLSAQGRYGEAERQWRAAARSFEMARLRSSTAGLARASFAAGNSPLARLAACLARNGKPDDAWRSLEAGLARGLLDDLSAQQLGALTDTERQRLQRLNSRLTEVTARITALLGGPARPEPGAAGLQALLGERQEVESQLAQFESSLAAREVYDLGPIQDRLPADATLVAWVDVKGQPKAADPNGEHWACLLRHRGPPAWVKLPGSGPQGAWTREDDDLPTRLRRALGQRPVEGAEDWQALAGRLRAQRLAPLEPYLRANGDLPAVQHLLAVPAWAMAGVPLEALTDGYTVSYVPSGTVLARLEEQRGKPADAQAASPASARLLVVGDPALPGPEPLARLEPPLPEHGVLVTRVVPGSNAARGGLQSGDVLLRYAGKDLAAPADLTAALRKQPGSPTAGTTRGPADIRVEAWRDGRTLACTVRPGPLGVQLNPRPAAEAIRARREGDRALRASRGGRFAPLHYAAEEAAGIAALFPAALTLLGPEASEQRLDELAAAGELRRCRYLHFATHGDVDDRVALNSALILSQDRVPDPTDQVEQVLAHKPVYDGRLTAGEILSRHWRLEAELVTLSACQTGLGKQAGGEGYLGLAQAFFLAGARSLVVSLWEVDDRATALLMVRFYQNLLGKRPGLDRPLPKAQALREAKTWLRGLSRAEADRLQAELPAGARGQVRRHERAAAGADSHPFAHPYYWSAFILLGDPS